jgi:hypothetical protein
MLADLGQSELSPSPDGSRFAGIMLDSDPTLPGLVLEMPEFKHAALGRADVTSAFQLTSRKEPWEVLRQLEDYQFKVKRKRKCMALYATRTPTRHD